MSIPKILNKYYQRYIPDDLRRMKTDLSNAQHLVGRQGNDVQKLTTKILQQTCIQEGNQ